MHFDAFQQQIGELPPALPARSLRKVSLTKFLVRIMHASGELKHPTFTVDFQNPDLDVICRFVKVPVDLCIWWFNVFFSFTLVGLLLALPRH